MAPFLLRCPFYRISLAELRLGSKSLSYRFLRELEPREEMVLKLMANTLTPNDM